ncbi:MAG: ribonuclease P protein component [bacterium]
MLPPKHRLKHDADIKAVVKKGNSVFDSVCGVKYRKNDLDVSRFAVSVGLKVHKSAVKRNRVKRHYREIVRLALDQIKPGYDVVLLTSSKAVDLEYADKEKRPIGVLKKAKLL